MVLIKHEGKIMEVEMDVEGKKERYGKTKTVYMTIRTCCYEISGMSVDHNFLSTILGEY